MSGKFDADLVPQHYTLNATLDANGMYELIVSLRRFVDEFEAPETAEKLLEALEAVYDGELPQRIDVDLLPDPGDGEDDGDEEEAYT